MGVQFPQEIAQVVTSSIYQWIIKKCEETDSTVFAWQETRLRHFVSLQFLKLYDQVYLHTRFGTSCQK